jgi:hypothetical protein
MGREEIKTGVNMCLAGIVDMSKMAVGINDGEFRNLSLGEYRDKNNKVVIFDDGLSARYTRGEEVYKIKIERVTE